MFCMIGKKRGGIMKSQMIATMLIFWSAISFGATAVISGTYQQTGQFATADTTKEACEASGVNTWLPELGYCSHTITNKIDIYTRVINGEPDWDRFKVHFSIFGNGEARCDGMINMHHDATGDLVADDPALTLKIRHGISEGISGIEVIEDSPEYSSSKILCDPRAFMHGNGDLFKRTVL